MLKPPTRPPPPSPFDRGGVSDGLLWLALLTNLLAGLAILLMTL